MPENVKAAILTVTLTLWTTFAVAQSSPGGTTSGGAPGSTGAGASTSPTGAAGGIDWIWILVALLVVAALLYYVLGRNRGTRV